MSSSSLNPQAPSTEDELLERCMFIAGMTFSQLAHYLQVHIPSQMSSRKGWIGQLLELFLGADAGNQAKPDFQRLSIELKTLPLGRSGKPSESTYVTSIPLLTIHQQNWYSSQCYAKLKRVLWIPIEGDVAIPYPQRRIGQGFLWSPNEKEALILEEDWSYLTSQISLGYLETLDARAGTYLQIRPKAADGKSLCYCYDATGNKVKTLPRGFYLRSSFTQHLA